MTLKSVYVLFTLASKLVRNSDSNNLYLLFTATRQNAIYINDLVRFRRGRGFCASYGRNKRACALQLNELYNSARGYRVVGTNYDRMHVYKYIIFRPESRRTACHSPIGLYVMCALVFIHYCCSITPSRSVGREIQRPNDFAGHRCRSKGRALQKRIITVA